MRVARTSASCKATADSALVNNIMVVRRASGMYVPTKFTYKTPR